MRLALNNKYPFVSFTDEEEAELARATFDMLEHPRFIRHDQYEFLKNKLWIGRGCFARPLNEIRFAHWLDCIVRFDQYGPWEIQIDEIRKGLQETTEGIFKDSYYSTPSNMRAEHIIKIWHRVWESHPVRTSAVLFKEWPYPEVFDGPVLLKSQPSRIAKAIDMELGFWEEVQKQQGGFSSEENCIEYVSEYHKTATHVLEEIDRDEWLRRIPEIVERIPIDPEVLASRVEHYDPTPHHLYLINIDQYKRALREYSRTHPKDVKN